jgi:predicted nucleic acid-binding protein
MYISTLTELELFSHVSMTEEEAIRLEAFLQAVPILPLTSQIARIAGDLRRSHAGLKAFDSGIAATALFTHSQLITRNIRDFPDIDGLSLLAL